MKRTFSLLTLFFALSSANSAQVRITIDHNTGNAATAEFKFKRVPSPVRNDAAASAKLLLVDAEPDPNSGDLSVLTDGLLPNSDDQPRRNFFLIAGSGGGRIRMDLGRTLDISQINSYSWHPNTRGPQVYRVWGSDGSDPGFDPAPNGKIDPGRRGWMLIATVDTRSNDEDKDGGQFGVSISQTNGTLGRLRYLLFDFYVTEVADDFGNTFYSEIDVIAK